jgi:hypothetical protein
MKRTAALLAMVVALAACSLADSAESGTTSPAGARDGDEGGTTSPGFFPGGEDMAPDLDGAVGRRVIRQARLQLHASDTREAFDRIVTLTESIGGFVANANVLPVSSEGAQPQINVTLRVPADRLTDTLRAIKEIADEVVSESQDSQDVSEQFVDLEARLTNLEALEVELRALLEEVRRQPEADPEKLLRVFNELASVRGQIEQVQGRINYLTDLTDLATVEVGITQTPTAVPIVEEPWAPGEAVRDAARSLVVALQGIADWIIRFGIYILPVLVLILAVPVTVGVYAYRRWWRNRPGTARTDPSTPDS